jgi:cell division protein FtsB
MDELYKEIHTLRRRISKLESQNRSYINKNKKNKNRFVKKEREINDAK